MFEENRGKLPVDKEKLTIFVMTGTRMDAQSFSKEVGIVQLGPVRIQCSEPLICPQRVQNHT